MTISSVLTPDFLKKIAEIILQSDIEIVTPMLARGIADPETSAIVEKGIVGQEKDYFTQIDQKNEDYLLARFRDILPGSFAIGEESFDSDRDGNIAFLASSDYAWVLDPIDGTNNVVKYLKGESAGSPLYGIMAALLHKGTPVAGWVFTSDEQQQKNMAFGADNIGSFFYDFADKAVKPLHFDEARSQSSVPHVVTTLPAWPKKFQPVVQQNIDVGNVRLYDAPPKSAAHEMMLLFANKVDAAAFRQIRLWDVVPGMVIARNAGGDGILFNGKALELADQRRNGFLVVARRAEYPVIRHALLGDIEYDQTEDPK